ncbi:MAG: hypothetical protein MHPSP_003368, partial [Paramarteilia canceri]
AISCEWDEINGQLRFFSVNKVNCKACLVVPKEMFSNSDFNAEQGFKTDGKSLA